MTPGLSRKNDTDNGTADAKFGCKAALIAVTNNAASDLSDHCFRQLGVGMRFAMCYPLFPCRISYIIRLRSQEEMGRIDTPWIISARAVVQEGKSFWDGAVYQFPGGSVC